MEGRQRGGRRRAEVLRARDAPVPHRRAAHGAPQELLDRRRGRALPPPHGPRVLHPMGYDAFGLPAENHAISTGEHPRDSTAKSIAQFQRQFRSWGISIDWTREFGTHEPRYYRWTQWIFLKLFERGLAYRNEAAVNWCPIDATVLANEQVIDGRCERCGTPGRGAPARAVVLPHHRLRRPPARRPRRRSTGPSTSRRCSATGSAAPRAPRSRSAARSWASDYPVFTTRPDTLFGATFFVMAPEHPDVLRLAAGTEHEQAVRDYVNHALRRASEERGDTERDEDRRAARPQRRQPGQRRADPDVGRRLRADGVRHRRDHGRPRPRRARPRLRDDVRPADPPGDRRRRRAARTPATGRSSTPIPQFDGLHNREALEQDRRLARRPGQGPPLDQLPPARLAALAPALLGLPDPDRLLRRVRAWCRCPRTSCRSCCPTSRTTRRKGRSPLAAAEDWVNTRARAAAGPRRRETDTMDTFVDSSWYFLRYCDADNDEAAWDPAVTNALDAGRPVHRRRRARDPAPDVRALLREGARGHGPAGLRRSRSSALFTQGMITRDGAKMSKSKGNMISPVPVRRALRRRHRPLLRPVHRAARPRRRLDRQGRRGRPPLPGPAVAARRGRGRQPAGSAPLGPLDDPRATTSS